MSKNIIKALFCDNDETKRQIDALFLEYHFRSLHKKQKQNSYYMRLIKTLLIILLLCWYVIASFWYVCRIKQDCQVFEQYAWYQQMPFTNKKGIAKMPTKPPVSKNSLVISDNNKNIAKTNSHFRFAHSSDLPEMDEEIKQAMLNLATYSSQNPDRQLTITGEYLLREKNQTNFDNLGLARAAHIRQHLIRKGANGNKISLAHRINRELNFVDGQTQGALHFAFAAANNNETPTPPAATTTTPKPTQNASVATPSLPDFVVKDGDKIIINTNTKFQYEQSANEPKANAEIQKGLNDLAAYLKKNPNKELQIMGFYGKNEKKNNIFDDLGLARATNIPEL